MSWTIIIFLRGALLEARFSDKSENLLLPHFLFVFHSYDSVNSDICFGIESVFSKLHLYQLTWAVFALFSL